MAAALAGVAVLIALAGCGSSEESKGAAAASSKEGKTVEVDVGTMKVPVKLPLHVAYFEAGTNNSYLQAEIKSAEKQIAKMPGATMTVFDGKFDPTTQFDEVQNAIQSHKYNAAIIPAVDPALLCDILSKQAPAAGMIVSTTTTPICKAAPNEGEGLWTPGTLDFIGGTHTIAYWKEYLEWVVKRNPGPQQVIVMEGPEESPITTNLNAALKEIEKEHPEFKVVGVGVTEYSVPSAQEKMGPLIQAHPNATILFSAYSNITKGAFAALEQAGKMGTMKVYDKGATEWAMKELREGKIESTTPECPRTIPLASLKALQEAFEGKSVPRFVPNDGAPLPAKTTKTGLVILTKSDMSGFIPNCE